MVILRPVNQKPSKVIAHTLHLSDDYKRPCFVIHPPTHELAEKLVVDSTALQDENYSGIYDESGDYIPQYCDNPEHIPRGSLEANKETSTESGGAETTPENPQSPENPPKGDETVK